MPVPTDTRHAFGARLRAARKRRYASAAAFADALGERGIDVTAQTVTGWERGEWTPPYEALHVIEELLGTDGELLAVLGYKVPEGVAELRAEVAELRSQVADLHSRVLQVTELIRQLDAGTAPDAAAVLRSVRRRRS